MTQDIEAAASALADSLLPRIAVLVERAIVGQAEADRLACELADLGYVSADDSAVVGGLQGRVDEMRDKLRTAEERALRAWAQVSALGGIVTNPTLGLVDFRVEVDGAPIRVCWQFGEGRPAWWHGDAEPCSTRRPIGSGPPHAVS